MADAYIPLGKLVAVAMKQFDGGEAEIKDYEGPLREIAKRCSIINNDNLVKNAAGKIMEDVSNYSNGKKSFGGTPYNIYQPSLEDICRLLSSSGFKGFPEK